MWNLFINNLPLKDISLASPDNFHTPFIFTAKMGDVSLKLTGTHCNRILCKESIDCLDNGFIGP